MEIYSTDYDKIREGEGKKVESKKTEKDKEINLKYDKQSADTKQAYETAIDDTKIAYEGEYQKNAVQKLINEQQIAEKNANLGLTSSGLNATQQTAVQLSYANQKGALDLAKRKDLEAKSTALTEALATIRQNRSDELDANANYWSGVADSNAQAIYNTNVDANTEMYNTDQKIGYDMWKAGLDADTELEKARIKAQSSGSGENTNSNKATLAEYQKVSNELNTIIEDKEFIDEHESNGGTQRLVMIRKKAVAVLDSYYQSGLLSDEQYKALVSRYHLENYL